MLCKVYIDSDKEMYDYFFTCNLVNETSMFNDLNELIVKSKVCILIADQKNHFEVFYNNNIIKLPKSLFYYEVLIN